MAEEAVETSPVAAPAVDPKDLAALLPWWKRPGWVTAITTIIAATVPVTTGVWGLVLKGREQAAAEIEKEKEIALQESKQKHDAYMEELKLRHSIQTDFLDRLKSDTERLRTLRMVAATSDDPKFAQWAKDEKDVIDADFDALKKRIQEQTALTQAAEFALADAQGSDKAKSAQITQLRADALRKQAELDRLNGKLNGDTIVISEAERAAASKSVCLARYLDMGVPIYASNKENCLARCAEASECPYGDTCREHLRLCIRSPFGEWPH